MDNVDPELLFFLGSFLILLSFILLIIGVIASVIHEYHKECEKKREWF